MARRKRRPDPWRGFLAGMAGGLAASWIMNQYQAGWSKASSALENKKNSVTRNRAADQNESQEGESEDATMKAADRLAQLVLHRELSRQEKEKAGPVMHYGFGALMGGCYGAISEYVPDARRGFGTLFGATVFIAADETAVPALGLSKKPNQYPVSSHLYGLSSHVVYGAATEAVRRLLAA